MASTRFRCLLPAVAKLILSGDSKLEIDKLIPGYVVLVRQFLSEARCNELIDWSEARGYEGATLSDGSMRTAVRNNDRVIVDDPPLAAKWWARIEPAVPRLPFAQPVGLNERFRFYRYHPGQRFRHHTDGVYKRSEHEFSQFTLLVYLNDNMEGGATEFTRLSVQPEQGMALLFLHQIEHAGAPVTRGLKYVLRTDVMYRSSADEQL